MRRETLEVQIHGISSEGAGVGRLPDGRTVFVHRTAPGDRAMVELTTSRPRWARGRLVELREAGPDRRDAPCPLFSRCGGCTLQHLDPQAQLEAKGEMVTSALARIGKVDRLPRPNLHPSPVEFGYRNRVTFTLRRRKVEGVVAGFHASEQPDIIVDVDERCLLPEPAIVETWSGLRANWGDGASRLPAGGELRLTLRGNASGEVFLVIRGGRGEGDPSTLLEAVPNLAAIWQNTGELRLLAGSRDVDEVWLGDRFPLGPEAFLQVNRAAGELLHRSVLGRFGEMKGKRVIDAYCGMGVYGRAAARQGARVTGIDTGADSVAVASTNAPQRFEAIHGRVEEEINDLLPADLVILNPPRTGVAPATMDALAGVPPSRILYVSCDPATLARDVSMLDGVFSVTAIDVFDLFPQTAHVETVLCLEK